mmetsp:Transcript_4446/g.12098  ORF Transcript_4446/g.12098 Transcript_4446/m.12098 type:complete len:211 (-) Transcript_4446:783-1415(-)
MLGLAPSCSRQATVSACPLLAAKIRGVCFRALSLFTSRSTFCPAFAPPEAPEPVLGSAEALLPGRWLSLATGAASTLRKAVPAPPPESGSWPALSLDTEPVPMPKKLPKSEERGFGWGEVVMVLARAARETVVAVVVVAISVLAVARGAVWGRGGRGDGEAAGSVREGLSKRKGEEEVVVPGRGTGPVPEGAAAVGERAGPPALGARLEG